MKNILRAFIFLFASILVACSESSGGGTTTGNPAAPEDNSTSGVVAEAVGGALSNSDPNGVQALYRANNILSSTSVHAAASTQSANSCPTYRTAQGSGCTESGATLWLDDADCSANRSAQILSGVQALVMSAGTASCGSFPNPGGGNILYRQFVSAVSSTTPGALNLYSAFGTFSQIDHATANLSNFDGDTLAPIFNSGYGNKVTYNSSDLRSNLVIGEHVSVQGGYDHSIYGSLSINETAAPTSSTVSGSIDVYHNLLKVIGNATFNNVIHDSTCCLPISGSISTIFRAGTGTGEHPTLLGYAYVGKTETLTFTGCGTATLQGYDGSIKDVSLSKCF